MGAMDMRQLLEAAVAAGASDLHVTAGLPPMLRVNGDVLPLAGWTEGPLSPETATPLIASLFDDRRRAEWMQRAEYDFSLGMPGLGRFRGNAYRQTRGPGVALRVIPSAVRPLEELGAPPALKELTERHHGLLLVTGPTGSGKSTTAAALVDLINQTRPGHIVTIEDPVEFLHESKKSIVTQREVGTDTGTFPAALRAALREDPDVIFVGEMRDLETISLAVTAAETGHLVIATLHTSGAAKSVDRIVNVFPSAEQQFVRTLLAGCLLGVASQALLRRSDQPGRIAAFEMLVATSGVRSLIRQGKVAQIASAIQTGSQQGMCTFRRSVQPLVAEGRVAQADADELLAQFEDDFAPPAGQAGAPARGQSARTTPPDVAQ
jgi:twitching motility protein PilT